MTDIAASADFDYDLYRNTAYPMEINTFLTHFRFSKLNGIVEWNGVKSREDEIKWKRERERNSKSNSEREKKESLNYCKYIVLEYGSHKPIVNIIILFRSELC